MSERYYNNSGYDSNATTGTGALHTSLTSEVSRQKIVEPKAKIAPNSAVVGLIIFCASWVVQLGLLQLLLRTESKDKVPSPVWQTLAPDTSFNYPFFLNLLSISAFSVFGLCWFLWYNQVENSNHVLASRVREIASVHAWDVVKRAVILTPLVILSGWLWFRCLSLASMPVATALSHLQPSFVLIIISIGSFMRQIMTGQRGDCGRKCYSWAKILVFLFTLLSSLLLVLGTVPSPARDASGRKLSKQERRIFELEALEAVVLGFAAMFSLAVYEVFFEATFASSNIANASIGAAHTVPRKNHSERPMSTVEALASVGVIADDNVTEEEALELVKLISPRTLHHIQEKLDYRNKMLISKEEVGVDSFDFSKDYSTWVWHGMSFRVLPFPPIGASPLRDSLKITSKLNYKSKHDATLSSIETCPVLSGLEQPCLRYGSFSEANLPVYNLSGDQVREEPITQSQVQLELENNIPYFLSDAAHESAASFLYFGVVGLVSTFILVALTIYDKLALRYFQSNHMTEDAFGLLLGGAWESLSRQHIIILFFAILAELLHNGILAFLPCLLSPPGRRNIVLSIYSSGQNYTWIFAIASLCGIPLAWIVEYFMRGKSSVNAVQFLAFFVISMSACLAAWLNADSKMSGVNKDAISSHNNSDINPLEVFVSMFRDDNGDFESTDNRARYPSSIYANTDHRIERMQVDDKKYSWS